MTGVGFFARQLGTSIIVVFEIKLVILFGPALIVSIVGGLGVTIFPSFSSENTPSKLAEIEMGEIFVQSRCDYGVECENPHKEIHDGPQPFLLGVTVSQCHKSQPITGVQGEVFAPVVFHIGRVGLG